ncbi:hypothetical protein E4U35_003000 [Claviceps purpurea]|uniref:Uncharacterized protein n=1 Tax=Claviceps purpurea (strain 20.1) TaxID=1111077 RepID=M1VW49_CLAP2|nr:hypothetical protein E4U12_004692 [Claviceps purpurea]CCE30652.1 uncharacterized protein CPUR_04501 [Claviceps purpurea 20.1]KAG6184325.1 hypothetical protein E4U36_002081 [Claviceps purpurea]KAG6204895.1 hypothetical protein E4U35_003000 [Claviceps purpurea]KAG6255302.1 hypothetical protein E4U23_004470 [Claviceps purpurea]
MTRGKPECDDILAGPDRYSRKDLDDCEVTRRIGPKGQDLGGFHNSTDVRCDLLKVEAIPGGLRPRRSYSILESDSGSKANAIADDDFVVQTADDGLVIESVAT